MSAGEGNLSGGFCFGPAIGVIRGVKICCCGEIRSLAGAYFLCYSRCLGGCFVARVVPSLSGRSAAWLARLVRDQEVEGSNPFAPTTFSLIFIGLLIMPLLPPKFVAQITILEAPNRIQLLPHPLVNEKHLTARITAI